MWFSRGTAGTMSTATAIPARTSSFVTPRTIVARSPERLGLMGRGSARFALEYVELFAPVLGLGTCWMGLVEGCAFSGHAPMLEALEIPADHMAAGVMTVGYPRHVYHRLVDRNPLEVYWD